jgi:hypothetical protein
MLPPGNRLRKSSDLSGTLYGMRGMCFIAASALLLHTVQAEVIHFDRDSVGSIPPGWSIAMTHTGAQPRWEIRRDDSAPHPPFVLAQVSRDDTAGRFPLAIWDGTILRDGDVSVAFRTVSGKVDQAAGIVWRYQDPDNYYVVRANALENNVVLYKVEKGVRLSIAPKGLPSRAYGVKHTIPVGRWNTLRVVFKDTLFAVFFDGERLFDIEDSTIRQAGKTGVWTKADSETYFNEFTIVQQSGREHAK